MMLWFKCVPTKLSLSKSKMDFIHVYDDISVIPLEVSNLQVYLPPVFGDMNVFPQLAP